MVTGAEAPVEVDAPVHGGRRWDPLHRRRRRLRMGMHESAFCDLVTRRRGSWCWSMEGRTVPCGSALVESRPVRETKMEADQTLRLRRRNCARREGGRVWTVDRWALDPHRFVQGRSWAGWAVVCGGRFVYWAV